MQQCRKGVLCKNQFAKDYFIFFDQHKIGKSYNEIENCKNKLQDVVPLLTCSLLQFDVVTLFTCSLLQFGVVPCLHAVYFSLTWYPVYMQLLQFDVVPLFTCSLLQFDVVPCLHAVYFSLTLSPCLHTVYYSLTWSPVYMQFTSV